MNRAIWVVTSVAVLAACAGLTGCHRVDSALSALQGPSAHNGRYFGVGIYSPSKQWTTMVGADDTKAPATAARMIDDQVVIVVQDSQTGEVRACGDLTGYCVSMNPWKKQLALTQIAPISLTEHVQPPTNETAAAPAKPSKQE